MQCRKCGYESPPGTAFCLSCGNHFGGLSADVTRPPTKTRAATLAARRWLKLTVIDKSGADGTSYNIDTEDCTIGRNPGATVAFADDPFLADSHLRIRKASGGITLEPLDEWNGIFLRVDGSIQLEENQEFLVGRQVFRLHLSGGQGGDTITRHDVALFGSPVKKSWGRIVQILANGDLGDVRLLCGETSVGREEGEIRFPEDGFLSRIHAMLRMDGGKAYLCDLKSSNGTYAKFTKPITVGTGACFRVGDQLFRAEL